MKLILTTALAVLFALPAAAQQRNCAPRDAVIERLAQGYGETRQSMGLGANNAVIEVLANTDTGTWSILVTTPNGVSCLVASGQSFEALSEALPPAGIDG